MVKFNDSALKEFGDMVARYPRKEAAMLPALRLLERDFGDISEEGMKYIAGLLDVPPAKVLGVVSFYTHYRQAGCGKHLIQVCSTISCALRHSEDLFDHLSKKLGLKNGETSPDKFFTLKKVECLASCGTAPVIQIDDEYYEGMNIRKADELIEKLSEKGR